MLEATIILGFLQVPQITVAVQWHALVEIKATFRSKAIKQYAEGSSNLTTLSLFQHSLKVLLHTYICKLVIDLIVSLLL